MSSDGLSIGSRYLVSLCHANFLLFLNVGAFQVKQPHHASFSLNVCKDLTAKHTHIRCYWAFSIGSFGDYSCVHDTVQ